MNTSFPTLNNPTLIPPKNIGKETKSDRNNRSGRSSRSNRSDRENSQRNNKEARIERMEHEKEEKKAKALSKASYPLNSSILQELIDNNVDKTLNLLEQFFQSSNTDELMRTNLKGIINILSGKKELCIRAIEKVEKIQNFDYETDASSSFFSIDTFLRYRDPEPIRLGKSKDEPDKYKSFIIICDLFGITAEQCLGTSQYDLILDDSSAASLGINYKGSNNVLTNKDIGTITVPVINDIKCGESIPLAYYRQLKFNIAAVNNNAIQFMESQSDVIKYWVLLGWLNKQLSHSGTSETINKQKGGNKKFDKHGNKKKSDGNRGDRDDSSKKREIPSVTGSPINLSDIIRNGSVFKTNPLYSLLSKSDQLSKKTSKKDKKDKKGGSKSEKNSDKGKNNREKKKNYDLNNNIENFSKFMIPCEDSYIRVGKYIDRNIDKSFTEQAKLTGEKESDIIKIQNILRNPIVTYYLSYLDSHDSGANSSDRKLFNRYMIKSLEGINSYYYDKEGKIDTYKKTDVKKDGSPIPADKVGDLKIRKVVGNYRNKFKDNDEINNLNERHFITIFKFLMTENNFGNLTIYFPNEDKAENSLFKKDDSASDEIDDTIKQIVYALVKLIDMSVVNMVGLTTRIYKDAYDGSIQIKKNMFGDLIGNGIIKNQMVPNLLGYYSYTYQRFDTFETELRERYREILEPHKKEIVEDKETNNRRKERLNRNEKKNGNQNNREPIYKNKLKTEKTFENKRERRDRQANIIAKRDGSRQNNSKRNESRNEKKYFIDKTQSPYTRALKMISKLEGMSSKNQKIAYFRRFKENDPKAFEEFKKNKILIQSLKNII